MAEQTTQQFNRFLKRRQVDYMIDDYFKIGQTGSVQFKDDNVQGFDTKSDKVLLSMTKVPEEYTLVETCVRKTAAILKGTETSHGIALG